MINDEYYMNIALEFAKEAAKIKEVPVGAIVIKNGQIIGNGFNRRESGKSSLWHAEMEAINKACKNVGSWRLHDCELYVTLEPCPMCAGAIINSRIKRVIFGAFDPKAGAFGSKLDINSFGLNHKTEVTCSVMKNECSCMLTNFFKDLR
ncbi:MAG: nucleoside deaminase [Ruminococcaceae bacterium]|nr:nucleoside deaminase [Oscillospiraceae bacterium]